MSIKKSTPIRNWVIQNGYADEIHEDFPPILTKRGYKPFALDEQGQPVLLGKEHFKAERKRLRPYLGAALARALFETELITANPTSSLILVLEGLDASGKSAYSQWLLEDVSRSLKVHQTRTRQNTQWTARIVSTEKPKFYMRTDEYLNYYRSNVEDPRYQITIMDRSWYNRAMVEPVSGFCEPQDYEAFFEQIHDFEQGLLETQRLIKLFLSTNHKEQLRRLLRREVYKPEKLSPVDIAGLTLRGAYEQHIKTMFESSVDWTLIRTDDKRYGYLIMLQVIIGLLNNQKPVLIHPEPAEGEEKPKKSKLPNVCYTPNHVQGFKKVRQHKVKPEKNEEICTTECSINPVKD